MQSTTRSSYEAGHAIAHAPQAPDDSKDKDEGGCSNNKKFPFRARPARGSRPSSLGGAEETQDEARPSPRAAVRISVAAGLLSLTANSGLLCLAAAGRFAVPVSSFRASLMGRIVVVVSTGGWLVLGPSQVPLRLAARHNSRKSTR